jgi:rod shape determining protein RodA
MLERRLYFHIDWALLLAILALCGLGVAMIYSTTGDPTRGVSRLHITQSYAIVLGLVAMVVTLTIDYRRFTDKSHLIYLGLLALLIYVMFFGTVQMGARRWITVGGFNLQPSEFAKIGVALVLAKFFGENRGTAAWSDLAIGGVLTLIPLALIAKEPDLGTAVTLLPIFAAVAFLAGMRMRVFAVLAVCMLLAAPIACSSIRHRMQKAPATSRSRRASRWGREGSQAKASGTARRDNCGSCRSPTTISSSRCWPRNRGLPASSWRSACICS